MCFGLWLGSKQWFSIEMFRFVFLCWIVNKCVTNYLLIVFFFKASFDRSILMTSSWQTQNISCKIITFQVFSKYRFFFEVIVFRLISNESAAYFMSFFAGWVISFHHSHWLLWWVCVWVMFLFTLQSVLRVFVGCVVCDCDCVKSWECLMTVCVFVLFI